MSSAAYIEISAVVASNPALLVSCRADLLVNDCKLLLGYSGPFAPARFGWIVNASSTHLIADDAGAEQHAVYDESFDRDDGSCRTDLDQYYLWDGTTLTFTDHDAMFNQLDTWRVELSLAA